MNQQEYIIDLYECRKSIDYIVKKVFGNNEDYYENYKVVEHVIEHYNKPVWVCNDCGNVHNEYPSQYEVIGEWCNEWEFGCFKCGSDNIERRC